MDRLVAGVMDCRLGDLLSAWRRTPPTADPLEVFAESLDHLVVIALGGNRCQYVHYGRSLVEAFGTDLTGQDIDYLPPVVLPRDRRGMLEFEYGFANRVQRPVWRSYTAEFAGGMATWQRLVLPFGPDRLVVGAVRSDAAATAEPGHALLRLLIDRIPVVLEPDAGVRDVALTLKDYSDTRLQVEEMKHLATRDPLTGVGNLRHFKALSTLELEHAARMGRPMAVLMLDIDHFKRINDTWGHAAGDEALRQFAAACRNALREPDILGRLGGEEFAIALPNTGADGAGVIAERLRALVEGIRVTPQCGGTGFGFTTSVGIAVHHPGSPSGQDVDELLARADAALYEAKRSGRNRVMFCEGER